MNYCSLRNSSCKLCMSDINIKTQKDLNIMLCIPGVLSSKGREDLNTDIVKNPVRSFQLLWGCVCNPENDALLELQ